MGSYKGTARKKPAASQLMEPIDILGVDGNSGEADGEWVLGAQLTPVGSKAWTAGEQLVVGKRLRFKQPSPGTSRRRAP